MRTNYSFEFDTLRDNQNSKILNYVYKDGEAIILRAPPSVEKNELGTTSASITGPMRRGTTLFVRWRDNGSGAIYEDTANLKSKLTGDLDGRTLYLMVKGPQLYVYLISNEHRPNNIQAIGPSSMSYLLTELIYPINQ